VLFVPKFCCFLLVVLRLGHRMLRMAVSGYFVPLSFMLSYFLLFCAMCFQVALLSASLSHVEIFFLIFCYFALLESVFSYMFLGWVTKCLVMSG